MTLSRRGFLRIAGTSAVIVAASAAGGAGFVMTRRPDAALAPWDSAGRGDAAGRDYADPRLRALSYAILAPNPHNRQPWTVDLSRPDEVLLFADLERRLPETDPFDRQLVIGFGCFLELLRQAAAEQDQTAEIEPFPEGAPAPRLDRRPLARIRFRPDTARSDPLFTQVFDRRSAKDPFDLTRPLTRDQLTALASVVDTAGIETLATVLPAEVDALRALALKAWNVELTTPSAWKESIDLLRIGRAEIEANPDGIDVGGVMPELLGATGLLTRETLLDPGSTAYAETLRRYRETFAQTPAFVWQVSQDDSRLSQLAAGRAWLRLNMKATELGLGLHPVSQALQEYPEMSECYRQLHARLGVGTPKRLQMFGRLGYGPTVPPSPRWPIEAKIRST